MLKMLKEMCSIPSPSGSEEEMREYILSRLPEGMPYTIDRMGNLLVSVKGKKAPARRLMLAAHMDEVGFIVTGTTEEGYLTFTCVGGILPEAIVGRRVQLGPLTGVIGCKPIHLKSPEERKEYPRTDSLVIDIGAKNKKNAEKLVSLGDTAVFESKFLEFGDGCIKARALDDKAGCAVLLDIIRSGKIEYDFTAAFTVQEEVGCRGAAAAAFGAAPDIAFVLEATTAADLPGVPEQKQVCRLRCGPAISFMDGRTVYDRGLYEDLFRVAGRKSIPCQPKAATSGGNDAGEIHKSREGVRTAAISMPCRYLHSAVCVIAKEDLFAMESLTIAAANEVLSHD